MKPYYEHAGITIYHGDSSEIVPKLKVTVDTVLSDPQYGIGLDVNTKRSRRSGLDFGSNKGKSIRRDPDWIPLQKRDSVTFNPTPFLVYPEVILWGANNYTHKLPPSRGWLIWDKLGDKQPCAFGDCELAWTSFDMSIRVWRQLWRGLVREGEENTVNGPKLHPCQKPAALMRWCLGFSKAIGVVLDPFMGSGTTLYAAKSLGRRAIGIEIEERYCEIAARRLSQEVLQFEPKANDKPKAEKELIPEAQSA